MPAELESKLAEIGVTRLVFVRHANATPPGTKAKTEYAAIHDWQRDDQVRPLTQKGKEQAKNARSWFSSTVTNRANKVLLTSGARRASETLQILTEEVTSGGGLARILGCSGGNAVATHASMDLLGSLHPAGIAPKCEEMFDTLGYGPLSKFYDKPGGKAAFQDYATIVSKEIYGILDKCGNTPGNTISCFGHAVFLNAVAMLIAEDVWRADETVLNELIGLDLGEAEAILLDNSGGKVTLQHLKC
eukprot:CAMPEP_0117669336 /NCGR_PEP_ID=MMETSP0804-20121206/12074_1 /TAXON_ID=1074897 /ORGANISM="Tetraselmis astigmatica, Strain CCMP880" /LENGTH=245 /DNA_ID=CAMNT_0005477379 /DNA_START=42 /DNA_END=779 /DNA_ORIENTATION=-